MNSVAAVRKFADATCRICLGYSELWRGPLFSDRLAVANRRHRQRGRPASYSDRALRDRALRHSTRWARHVRVKGLEHCREALPDDVVLVELAERILEVAEREPRLGDGVIAWVALRRLAGWQSGTGRYGQIVELTATQKSEAIAMRGSPP